MKKALLFSLALLSSSLSFADGQPPASSIKVIPLHYKTADQIIPGIKPFLSSNGVIDGQGNQVIVKTDPQNLQQINQLIQQLDVPPVLFMVTVRTETGPDDIMGSKSSKVISTNTISGSSPTTPMKQQVKVLEGNTVLISVSQTIPVQNYGYSLVGGPANNTQYTTVESGFYLTPRLSGDNVLVDIQWKSQSLNNNQPSMQQYSAIDNQNVNTKMALPLGEWSNISNTSDTPIHDSNTRVYGTNEVKNPTSSIYIKVDRLDS